MDSVAIQTKLQEINSLLAEVLQALPSQTASSNDIEPSKEMWEKVSLNSVPLFEGFNVHNDVHTCYLLLCHRAGSNHSQNEVIKQYLTDAGKPANKAEVDRLRKSVDYLCKSLQLTKPWRENARESGSE